MKCIKCYRRIENDSNYCRICGVRQTPDLTDLELDDDSILDTRDSGTGDINYAPEDAWMYEVGQSNTQKAAPVKKKRPLIPVAIVLCIIAAVCAVIFLAPHWENNVLMETTINTDQDGNYLDCYGLGIHLADVYAVTFQDDLSDMPDNARDVSQSKDGSVKAWVVRNGERYHLYIAARGGINGSIACKSLFANYTALEKVYFNEAFHTEQTHSMQAMFLNCSSLKSLDLLNLDTSNVSNMSRMFSGCSGLTSLNVSTFQTENVVDFSFMFQNCSGLEQLTLGNFNTPNAGNMSRLFENCSSLTTLDVSSFDTESVYDMSYMFRGCSKLTSLNVSGFDTSNVIQMHSMFFNCASLTELDVSGFDTSSVFSMNQMFQNCSSLTTLDVSNFNTSGVYGMSHMFCGCKSLTALDVSNFDTHNVNDMDFMFKDCGAYVDASGFDISNIFEHQGFMDGTNGISPFDN